MGETDLQLGGGYTYQWECAILLALNYFYDPVRYNPILDDLVTGFLGEVEEIHLEGKDQEAGVELEDICLVRGPRRILIQVKAKQADWDRWTSTDPLLLKSLCRFYDSGLSAAQLENTRFVFLTNRPFNHDLTRIQAAVSKRAVNCCPEAEQLLIYLEGYAQKEKGATIEPARFREMLARTALVEFLGVDEAKANVQAKLQAYGRADWQQVHAVLFEHFARQSTHAGGGVVTHESLSRVLGPGSRTKAQTQMEPHIQRMPTSTLLTFMGGFLSKTAVSLSLVMLEKMPGWLVDRVPDRLGKKPGRKPSGETVTLFSSSCGDGGIDLAQQRLLMSSAFGTYFTGLLERERSYVNLKGQIEVSGLVQSKSLEPIQSVYWALQYPKGPRVVIIAAEGGMGKSTLATKIIRCLYEEHAVDMILGDSAKTQEIDPVSGALVGLDPAYYNPETFYERLCSQLGLPYRQGQTSNRDVLKQIQDRLEGRRAIIVMDNLETVSRDAELLDTMRQLATRDTRVIVTTRVVSGLTDRSTGILLIHLKPIGDFDTAKEFVKWHTQTHAIEHPGLTKLEQDVDDRKKVQRLIDRTGGIPLLIQLVVSSVARSSWAYLDTLPELFGKSLLGFLYSERWDELGSMGQDGMCARRLLRFVNAEQYRGKKITFDRIRQWGVENECSEFHQTGLRLLQERFLIVNHDPNRGNFAVFPSLAEFLRNR